MNGPEVTFTVHPRPVSADPKSIVDTVPAATAAATEAVPLPAEDRREWDTFLGNLAFLVRYAFGRY